MRVLVDHSCVEVYLSSGEVLSTRVYRGHPPHEADAGIDFVAYGGIARVEVSCADMHHLTSLPHQWQIMHQMCMPKYVAAVQAGSG